MRAQEDYETSDSDENLQSNQVEIPPYPDECRIYLNKTSELQSCLSDYISEYVINYFRVHLFNDYSAEKYTIYIDFKINKRGKIVDIKTTAATKELKKETVNALKRIPKFNPGMRNGRKASVIYRIPIYLVAQ